MANANIEAFAANRETPPLPTLSKEQQNALQDFLNGYHIKVTALAGSGKSTLLIHILLQLIKRNPQVRVVMISYNRDLVNRTIEMLDQYCPHWQQNVFVGTFHSLLSSIANQIVENELLFLETFSKTNFHEKQGWRFSNFEYLLLDECQDIRPSFFELIVQLRYVICLKPEIVRICGVGDFWQILYDYYPINRADVRFLTMMPLLFTGSWKSHQLTISYRSTTPMANVINAIYPGRGTIPRPNQCTTCVGKTNAITQVNTLHTEEPVICLITDLYQRAPFHILPVIQKYHKTKTIMILSSSLNEKSPVIGVVDKLVANQIPVHVSRSGCLSEGGTTHRKESTSKNKVICQTCCSAKGLEADIGIVLTFNNIFEPENVKPQDYVAHTRAKEMLFLVIHHRSITKGAIDSFMKRNPQLKQSDLRIILDAELKDNIPPNLQTTQSQNPQPMITTEEGIVPASGVQNQAHIQNQQNQNQDQQNQNQTQTKTIKFASNTLFNFLDVVHLKKLLQMIRISQFRPPVASLTMYEDKKLNDLQQSMLEHYFHEMNITFNQGQTYVNVSQIIGVAITLALEYTVTHSCPLTIVNVIKESTKRPDEKYMSIKQSLEVCQSALQPENDDFTPASIISKLTLFARMAALLDSFGGYGEKLAMLEHFDFINKPSIFARYRTLVECLIGILIVHNLKPHELRWYVNDSQYFKLKDQSIKIETKPTIMSKCGSLLIDIIHAPQICHEHHLSALISSQIAGDANTNVYIINIGDGSVEKSNIEPLKQHVTRADASLNFVSAAIIFKLYKEDSMSDESFLQKFKYNL
jgi:hypothetical protein